MLDLSIFNLMILMQFLMQRQRKVIKNEVTNGKIKYLEVAKK